MLQYANETNGQRGKGGARGDRMQFRVISGVPRQATVEERRMCGDGPRSIEEYCR